jgi:Na+-transporting methylmalonyl-CoA/oxaloacetate decarboxylase gamma subunit
MITDDLLSTHAWWWAGNVRSSNGPDMRFKCVVEVDGEGIDGVVRIHLFSSGESWIGHAKEAELESGRLTSSDEGGDEEFLKSAELSDSSRVAKVRQSLSKPADRYPDDVGGEDALSDLDCSCMQVHVVSNGTARAVTFAHVFRAPDVGDSRGIVRGMGGLRVVFAVLMLKKCPNPGSFLIYLIRRMSIAKQRLEELKAERAQTEREADSLDRAVDIVRAAVDQDEESRYVAYAEAFCDELNTYKKRLADNPPSREGT